RRLVSLQTCQRMKEGVRLRPSPYLSNSLQCCVDRVCDRAPEPPSTARGRGLVRQWQFRSDSSSEVRAREGDHESHADLQSQSFPAVYHCFLQWQDSEPAAESEELVRRHDKTAPLDHHHLPAPVAI